jgi:hypothetical protein
MTRSVALAVLLALLAPPNAEASPSARVEHGFAHGSVASFGSAEIVAAIVEGSIRGSALIVRDSLDVPEAYTPGSGSAAASPRGRSTARSGPASSPADGSAGARMESASDAAVKTSSAPALETRDADSREAPGAGGTSVVGFWLLIIAGVAGALLLIGAGRVVRPAVRRR